MLSLRSWRFCWGARASGEASRGVGTREKMQNLVPTPLAASPLAALPNKTASYAGYWCSEKHGVENGFHFLGLATLENCCVIGSCNLCSVPQPINVKNFYHQSDAKLTPIVSTLSALVVFCLELWSVRCKVFRLLTLSSLKF